MNSRIKGVSISGLLALFLSLPGVALALSSINSVVVTGSPVQAGYTIDVAVNVTTDNPGDDNDWESTYIALDDGVTEYPLYCGNEPNLTDDTTQTVNFNDLPVPLFLPPDTYTLVVRAFADNNDCAGALDATEDDEDTSQSVEVTANSTVGLDLVLCLDSSGSLGAAGWTLQIDGTQAGLSAALASRLDSTVRVTVLSFSSGTVLGAGPTIIDSGATLTAFNAIVDALPHQASTTNTASCISAAFDVLCGGMTCPTDDVRRIIDISTDGEPTADDCPGTDYQICAETRSSEAETAGVDVLNVIGVLENVDEADQAGFVDNMEALVFPAPVDVYGEDDVTCDVVTPPESCFAPPGSEGFVQIVHTFAQYEPAISAKLLAETTESTFTVNKTYSDDNQTAVDIELTCTGDTQIADNTLQAGPGSPAEFDVSGFDVDDECTATESNVPDGYTTDASDCVDVNIEDPGSCTIANTQDPVQFVVNKVFSDGNTADVTISLSCTDVDPADIDADDTTASESDPANFTVNNFPSAGTTCTATEIEPNGYTAVSLTCNDTIGLADDGECTITNNQDPVQFVVNKSFSDGNPADVTISLSCTDVDPADIDQDDTTASESDPANFTVNNFPFGGTTCTATESGVPAGYTPVSLTCNDTIGLDDDGECTVTNNQNPVTFTVTKDFDDNNNTASVNVSLSCTDVDQGDITVNDGTATESDTADFTVSNFPYGGTTCTATESGVPDGYTPVSVTCNDGIGPNNSGACTITNEANTGTLTVRKQYTDNNTTPVSVTATCTAPAIVLNNPQLASPTQSAVFNLSRVTEGTTCSATEAVPAGYEADQSDCQDVDVDSGCAIINSPVGGRVTFTVQKLFMDGNDETDVELNISCNTGLPLDQSRVAELVPGPLGSPKTYEVEFVVVEFDEGELDCTVWETPVDGYIASYNCDIDVGGTCDAGDPFNIYAGTDYPDPDPFFDGPCEYDDVAAAGGPDEKPWDTLCVIRNYPAPVTVEIDKRWVIESSNGLNGVSTDYDIFLFCDSPIIDADYELPSGGAESGQGVYGWYAQFIARGAGPLDVDWFAKVIPDFPSTTCKVEEDVFDPAVEVDNGCGDALDHEFEVSAGAGYSCTITNTVFFEGIPTLGQYGKLLLALLLLGVGLVGFRRFA